MGKTFQDFKDYTYNLEVNKHTWLKNLFTPATENEFPKWVYYVSQDGSNISTLLRCCKGDLKPQPIVTFSWGLDSKVEARNNEYCIDISLDTPIESNEWYTFLKDDGVAVQDVIISVLNPLMIS